MYRILTSMIEWLNALVAQPRFPDPLERMSPTELADLPITHPRCDV